MTAKPFEFAKALKELEDITQWFEGGDLDLDQGLVKFERGMELTGALKAHLAEVENQVEKIKQRFSAQSPSGSTSAEPAEPESPAEPSAGDAADDGPSPEDREQTGLFGS